MARSEAETALGGLMLGMSMPTVLFGGALLLDMSESLGVMTGTVAILFGAMITLGAVMQALSGATLLWAHRVPRSQVKAMAKGKAPAARAARYVPQRRSHTHQPRVRARGRHVAYSQPKVAVVAPPAGVRRRTVRLER